MDEFVDLDRFTTGAIGPPGERVFYLQASAGPIQLTLRLEKQQVAVLAQYLAGLLADLPPVADVPTDLELLEPVEEAWIVGEIAVAVDEALDRLVVRADELEGERAARFALTRGQVQAFVVRATSLVEAGRPPCPLCGRPIDPEGHMCLKTNGHKKR